MMKQGRRRRGLTASRCRLNLNLTQYPKLAQLGRWLAGETRRWVSGGCDKRRAFDNLPLTWWQQHELRVFSGLLEGLVAPQRASWGLEKKEWREKKGKFGD